MRPVIKFAFRVLLFVVVALLILEVLVQIFHLHKDTPERMIDDRQVEHYKPGQHGYSVTGNRRQNFSEYRINQSGFNSQIEYQPSEDSLELALVGDSFIEGFHEDYQHSLGRQIEAQLPGWQVYEYGYAGYDLADELHLIHAYAEDFQKVDLVLVYLRFQDDLSRGDYKVSRERLALQEGIFRWLKRSKLLVYVQNTGLLNAARSAFSLAINAVTKSSTNQAKPSLEDPIEKSLNNFRSLLERYPLDWSKSALLLDGRITPKVFIGYLESQNIPYLDFGEVFGKSGQSTTLIYDQHWNSHGRALVARQIAEWVNR